MPKTIVPLCVALLLSACGQTGALYLPDKGAPKRHAKAVPVKVVAPNSDTDSEATAAPAAPSPAPNATPDGNATPPAQPDAAGATTPPQDARAERPAQ
ncbi:LPS translocon maturation chaperone LptM [Solimonas soli]|uniref:LPS translocon maturation chaperone LptM n=1 Tax=Solimonas soli TaxID=413479 RepID=UPI0004876FE9|nr:lipoprotein [Solimonas soli]